MQLFLAGFVPSESKCFPCKSSREVSKWAWKKYKCHYFWLIVTSIIFILSVKRSHHVRREGIEIPTLIQKREEYTPLDFMKIWRSRLIQRIHKFGIKIRKSKEFVFNTNTINKYINSELKIRKIVVNVYLSVKRSHHVCREGLEIPTIIQKREEYTPLDFMKIWRSRLIQRIHKLGIK
jgi:Na+-translocating ferredoxin:NAD+ oxidoreductase RnfC subunit